MMKIAAASGLAKAIQAAINKLQNALYLRQIKRYYGAVICEWLIVIIFLFAVHQVQRSESAVALQR